MQKWFFSQHLDADVNLDSVQANEKQLQNHWEREGMSETEYRDETHKGTV